MNLTKSEVMKLARSCGLFIIESDNGGLLVEGRDSDPQGLLNLCNAIAEKASAAQREKDAKICDDMADSETFGETTFYPGELTDAGINYSQCADAIRANKE